MRGSAEGAGDLAAQHAGHEQRAEEQRIAQFERQRRKECEVHLCVVQ